MDEQSEVSLSDLIKVKVFDREGSHIGHVQDLAVHEDLEDPAVTHLGIHFLWSDRVGDIELVRSVEDIVMLVPWARVARFDEDRFELTGRYPETEAETASGRVLLRMDILDKQMVDPEGNRIQRVDEVILRQVDGALEVAGLEVSPGLLAGSSIRNYVTRLRRKHKGDAGSRIIPWEAVKNVREDTVVIAEVLRHEDPSTT